MYVSVKEGEKRVSVIAHTETRKNARDDLRFAREKKEYTARALWKRYIAYKTRALLKKRTLMIKLNSWLISAWNANVSVSSSPAMMIFIVCVLCAL